jgi:glutathione synthase/RimK-type ligase-like ATP-grasp enzyme
MRAGIATCDSPPVPDLEGAAVAAELERLGHSAELVPWDDPRVDWSGFDVVWISSTWDYHQRVEEFRDWLRRTGVVTHLENPRVLVDWNIDKRYLRDLGGAGLPLVPTVWAMPELASSAAETVGDLGWEKVIVKPTVDLGAMRLELVGPEEVAAAVERVDGPALVQPYLPSIATDGELSLVFVRGELSHAVRKRAAEGDFRVQEAHGGAYAPEDPSADAVVLGERTMAELDRLAPAAASPLYARVDLVRDLDGRLCVIEIELIEPSLFLELVEPGKLVRFAALLAEAAE